jgi:hypothetical protein
MAQRRFDQLVLAHFGSSTGPRELVGRRIGDSRHISSYYYWRAGTPITRAPATELVGPLNC